MKRLHTLFLFLTIAITLIAQPICQVKHFSVSDGLAQGVVMNILQDQKGLIWFSTWNGLNKFDGYTFKTYKTSQESKYAFGSNRMGTISESKYGDIWCPTYDGQACLFDVESEKFIDVLQPIEFSTKQTNYVTRIYSLEKGIAWILCANGYAFRVDEQLCKKGEGITLYAPSNHNLKGDQIFNVYQDSEEDEWILTDKGVSIIGKKTLDTDFPFQFITQIKESIYLIAENDKLARYDFHTKKLKFVDIPYPHDKINNVTTIGKDMLALGTDNGLILYSIPQNSFQQIDIRTATQTSNFVESVYQDCQGEIWIFSKDPGIVRLNLATNEKEHLFTPKDEIIKHGRKSRKLIFEDNANNLWLLPTEGNFCYYDRKEKTLKPLLTDINNPKSIFSPLVRYYTLDNQGNCWFATARGVEKLCFFPQSYQFNLTDYEAETRAFLQDSHNRLWTASKSNYIQIFAPDGSLVGYLSKQGNITKEKQAFFNGVYSILEDKEGNIWLGTKDIGLFQLKSTGVSQKIGVNQKARENHYSIHHFKHQPNDPYSLSSNSIYTIFQDSRNNIWVGCYGGGLNLLTQTKDGKTSINYNNSFRFGSPINKKEMMNSVQFASWVNDALTNNGGSPRFNEAYMDRLITWQNAKPYALGQRMTADGTIVYPIEAQASGQWYGGFSTGADDVNYYDVVYKDHTFSQEHNVSASGGSKKFNYYASGSYFDQDGLLNVGEENLQRFTATAKINSEITDWLKFNMNMRFTREDYVRPSALTDYFYEALAFKAWPILPLYDRNGYYYYSDDTSVAALAEGGSDKKQTDHFYFQTGLEIEPVKNWVTSVAVSYTHLTLPTT